IAPGDPFRSTLFYRINTEGSGRMPHIGSRVVDEAGVRVIQDWIRSLPAAETNDTDVAAARKLAHDNALLLQLCLGNGRSEALPRLLATTSGALSLLSQATTPSASAPFRSDVATIASTQTNAVIRDLFQRLLPADQRRQTLGSDFNPQTVLAL